MFCLSTGLGNSEMNPGKSTSLGSGVQGGKAGSAAGSLSQVGAHVTHGDSEELNKVVVLSLARAIHINGLEQQSAQWVKETLVAIMQRTPHTWPSHTVAHFPSILQDFYKVGSKYISCAVVHVCIHFCVTPQVLD